MSDCVDMNKTVKTVIRQVVAPVRFNVNWEIQLFDWGYQN